MARYLSKSGRLVRHFISETPPASVASITAISNTATSILSPNSLFRRFESVVADGQKFDSNNHDDATDSKVLNFPGGVVKFTPELKFLADIPEERIHCYRVLGDDGQLMSNNFVQIDKDTALKMYKDMVMLKTMDTVFYEAQRQGRISFYVTAMGEEAINIASAAALSPEDFVFPQVQASQIIYLFFTYPCFVQCNANDELCSIERLEFYFGGDLRCKNLQTSVSGIKVTMVKAGRCLPIMDQTSTIISQLPQHTQIPHAVGAAYALKMDGQDVCTITYFGDGGTSTGDFHAALNFAAVMEAPVIFLCRNNGWAISTPVSDQFRSDGIVVRGQAYGVRSIRVDGNDALAIYSAVRKARDMAIKESRPVLIEALTYRAGHHSTSDDSSKYRPIEEIEWWRVAQDPVTRFSKWLERNGWWTTLAEAELRDTARKEVLHAIQVAEKVEKPSVQEMFTDVYDVAPSNLHEQEKSLRETIQRHPQDYTSDFQV